LYQIGAITSLNTSSMCVFCPCLFFCLK
jgi:hypothetical protein